jgi:nucleoside-diphosphate-sugar epimerase
MKVLFVGGTGSISASCVQAAVARGFDVTILSRAQRVLPPGAAQITADINDPAAAASVLEDKRWDVVADFIAFRPEQIEQRVALFRGRTGQYVFISSASAYQKPLTDWLITESTPLANPFWQYSRDKIACEERLLRALREDGFPFTVVRPSWTYGDGVVPVCVNSSSRPFTAVARLRRGKPLIIPGDGLTLWTMTHVTDFAKAFTGLLGHQGAIGHAFHITSDEALTWNQIYQDVAEAAGVAAPSSNCAVFDNAKIKRFVPDYVATTRLREGVARSIHWLDADLARQEIDPVADAAFDKLIAAHERGLDAARREFGQHAKSG